MSGLAILERWPPGRARSFAHPTSAHSGGHDVGCTAGPPTKYAERAGADEMVELQSFTCTAGALIATRAVLVERRLLARPVTRTSERGASRESRSRAGAS